MLELAQAGATVPDELVSLLSSAVLDAAPLPVRLALLVREGGEHATRRLIELAEAVLAGDQADQSDASHPPARRERDPDGHK